MGILKMWSSEVIVESGTVSLLYEYTVHMKLDYIINVCSCLFIEMHGQNNLESVSLEV